VSQSSNLWNKASEITIILMNKLRPHWTVGMPTAFRSTTFCLPLLYPQFYRPKCTEIWFLLLVCAAWIVEPNYRRKTVWGYWKQRVESDIWAFGTWRAYSVVPNYLYYSISYICVIISRTMRWVGHVARMEEGRDAYRDLPGK
jgi:hypothetical protein